MRELEVDHDGEGGHGPGYKLVAVHHEVTVQDKDATDAEIPRLDNNERKYK